MPRFGGDELGGGGGVLGRSARSGAGFGKMRFCAGGGGTMITGYGLDMNWAFAGAFAATANPRPAAKAKIFDVIFGSPSRPVVQTWYSITRSKRICLSMTRFGTI